MSQTHAWDTQISDSGAEICQWITTQGGWSTLNSSHLLPLVQSIVDQIPVTGYTFIPTSKQLLGVITYWLDDNVTVGNEQTGCVFT